MMTQRKISTSFCYLKEKRKKGNDKNSFFFFKLKKANYIIISEILYLNFKIVVSRIKQGEYLTDKQSLQK